MELLELKLAMDQVMREMEDLKQEVKWLRGDIRMINDNTKCDFTKILTERFMAASLKRVASLKNDEDDGKH